MKNLIVLCFLGMLTVHGNAQDPPVLGTNRPQMTSNLLKNTANDTTRAHTAKIYRMKEIVITATRSEKELDDAGRSVTLITRDQMSKTVYHSAAEILSQQEGVYIVGVGQNPGAIQSIFMRGAASNHTTIMMDDVRISDPSAVVNALDLSELSLVGSDRIEIVRGSHGTLYGSSAIGGVINILTMKNGKPGLNTDVGFTTGTFGKGTSVFSENAFLNYTSLGGIYINAGINNLNINGLDAAVDPGTNPTAYNNRDRDGLDKRDLVGKIGFVDNRFDVYASIKNTVQKTDLDKGAFTDDDNYSLDFERNMFTYGVAYTIDNAWKIKILGGYSAMGRVTVDDSSIVDEMGNTDHSYFDGRWEGTAFSNEIVGTMRLYGLNGTIGLGLQKETMTSKTYFYSGSDFGVFESLRDLDTLDLNATTGSLFAHLDFNGRLLDERFSRFSVVLGARWNRHSAYGDNPTYEIMPSLRMGDGSLLFASYSTGFNAPSLYQLYTPERDYSSGITRGNGDLKPEESSSYEIGIKQNLGSFTLGVSYFNTVIANAIDYIYLWNKNIPVNSLSYADYRGDTYLNIGKQINSGIEFGFHSSISEEIDFSGNVSLVTGKMEYDPADFDTSHTQGNHLQIFANGAFITGKTEIQGLARRPNTANLNLTYQATDRFAVRVDAKYAGGRDDIYYESALGPFGALGTIGVEDYTLVDLSFTYKIIESLSLMMRAENIFNKEYREINGYTTRGRGVFMNLQFTQ